MKEYIVKIPECEVETISNVLEKFGVEMSPIPVVVRIKDEKKRLAVKKNTSGKTGKKKIDHTYLFDKWKDFDMDAKKLREQSW